MVPTLEPPVGWSVAVTVTLTGARPPRRTWAAGVGEVGASDGLRRSGRSCWCEKVVVVKFPMKPD